MDGQCSICCAIFQSSDELCSPLCGHVLHVSCLSQWLERWKTCPKCRRDTDQNDVRRFFFYNVENSEFAKLRKEIEELEEEKETKENILNYREKASRVMEGQIQLLRTSQMLLRGNIENSNDETRSLRGWISQLGTKLEIVTKEYPKIIETTEHP